MSEIRHLFCWKGIANTKGVDIMENVQRNDVARFFEDMPDDLQRKAIVNLNRIIKKPPE